MSAVIADNGRFWPKIVCKTLLLQDTLIQTGQVGGN